MNCINKLNYLLDETVVVESPRQLVLNLIRKMNPHVFIQGLRMQPMVDPSLLQDFDRLFSTSLIFLKCLIPTCPVRVKRGWLLRVSHVGGRQ